MIGNTVFNQNSIGRVIVVFKLRRVNAISISGALQTRSSRSYKIVVNQLPQLLIRPRRNYCTQKFPVSSSVKMACTKPKKVCIVGSGNW